MFGSLDGQLLRSVVMNHLWDAVERSAVLAQNILAVLGPGKFHVHKPLAAPVEGSEGKNQEWEDATSSPPTTLEFTEQEIHSRHPHTNPRS